MAKKKAYKARLIEVLDELMATTNDPDKITQLQAEIEDLNNGHWNELDLVVTDKPKQQ
jgi:hypothetical protein